MPNVISNVGQRNMSNMVPNIGQKTRLKLWDKIKAKWLNIKHYLVLEKINVVNEIHRWQHFILKVLFLTTKTIKNDNIH